MNSLSLLGQRKDICKSRLMEESVPDSSYDDAKVSNRSLLLNTWRKSSRKLCNSCRNLLGSDRKSNKGNKGTEAGECITQKSSQKGKDECESSAGPMECAPTPEQRRKALLSSKSSSSPKSVGEKVRAVTPFRRRKTMTNAEDSGPISHHSPKPKSSSKLHDRDRDITVCRGEGKRSGTPFRSEVFEPQRSHSQEESVVAMESSTKKRSITPYRKSREDSSRKETETLIASEKSQSIRENRSKQSSSVLKKQRSRRRLHRTKSNRSNSSRMHCSSSELSYDITRETTRDTKSSSDLNYMHHSEGSDRLATSSSDKSLNVENDDCLNMSLNVLNLHADNNDRHAMSSSSNLERGNISYSNESNYPDTEKEHHRYSKSSNELNCDAAEKRHRPTKSSSDLKYDHPGASTRVTKTFPRVTKTYGAGPSIEKSKQDQKMRVFRDGNGSTRTLQYSFVKQKSYRGLEVKSQDSIKQNDNADCRVDEEEQVDRVAGENCEESTRSEQMTVPPEEDSTAELCGSLEVFPEHSSIDEFVKDGEKEEGGIDTKVEEEVPIRTELMRKVRGKGSMRRLLSSFGRQKSYRGPEATSEHASVDRCKNGDTPDLQDCKINTDGDSDHTPVPTASARRRQSETEISEEEKESDPAPINLVRAEVEKIERKIDRNPYYIRSRSCRNLEATETSSPYLYRPTLTKSHSMGRLGNRSFLSGSLTGNQKSNMVAAYASIIPSAPVLSRKRSSTPYRSRSRNVETENDELSDSHKDENDTEPARSVTSGRAARLGASRNRSHQSRNYKHPSPVACTQ